MVRFINWLASSVLFPLMPMGAVWFFKGLESGSYSFSNLSGTDLAFATAMICVVSIVRVKNVGNDQQLQEGMSNIFSLGLVICLILFTSALLYQVQAENLVTNFYVAVNESLKNGSDVAIAVKGIAPEIHKEKLETFRAINSIFAGIIVLIALFCNFKYDLDRPQL